MCNNIYKVNILPQVKKKKQQTFNQKTQTTTEIIKLYLFLLFSFFFLLFSFFAKKKTLKTTKSEYPKISTRI